LIQRGFEENDSHKKKTNGGNSCTGPPFGKMANNGMVSDFTKEGIAVHKEEDVLITCKDKPIFIGVRDGHG
jgi:hypothetical protein